MDTAKVKHRRFRARIAENKSLDLAYRITVGVVGTVVLVLGVLAIPYPGPGWLIVFAGLGILASEFAWAKSALRFVRKRYDAFMAWFSKQSMFVKGLVVTHGLGGADTGEAVAWEPAQQRREGDSADDEGEHEQHNRDDDHLARIRRSEVLVPAGPRHTLGW